MLLGYSNGGESRYFHMIRMPWILTAARAAISSFSPDLCTMEGK